MITRGFGTNTIVTRGLGAALAIVVIVEQATPFAGGGGYKFPYELADKMKKMRKNFTFYLHYNANKNYNLFIEKSPIMI